MQTIFQTSEIYTHLYVIYTQNIFQTSEADMLAIGGKILSVDSWGSAGTSGGI